MENAFANRLLSIYRWFTKSVRTGLGSGVVPLPKSGGSPQDVAAIAIHAWKIVKRSERDSGIPRPVGRNAEQILAILQGNKVEIISYLGRKTDGGAKIEILEVVEGEENVVVEEHEPEVQVDGILVRRAVVSVGQGEPQPMDVVPPANQGESASRSQSDTANSQAQNLL